MDQDLNLMTRIWRHLSGDAVGQFIGSIVVLLGIGLFALPMGVLARLCRGAGQKKRGAREVGNDLPHCGRHIGDAAGRSGIDGLVEMRAK